MPASPPSREDPEHDRAFEARVLRAFVRNGRLVSIPARDRRKRVVLRFVLDEVLPDERDVEEPELNTRLATIHPDFAALRRYLIDYGLASRHGMTYRRASLPTDGQVAARRGEDTSE